MDFTTISQQQLTRPQAGGLEALLAQQRRAAAEGGVDQRAQTRQGLRAATKEFEAIFMYQMISAMRKTIGDGGLIKKSNGQEIFEGMLDEEWSRKLAGKYGSRGLADILYQQLSRQMGLEDAEAAATPGDGLLGFPPAQGGAHQIREGSTPREGSEE